MFGMKKKRKMRGEAITPIRVGSCAYIKCGDTYTETTPVLKVKKKKNRIHFVTQNTRYVLILVPVAVNAQQRAQRRTDGKESA